MIVNYIIFIPNSSPWQKSEHNDPKYAPKLIVLDEFDGALNFAPFCQQRQKHYPLDPHTKAPLWEYICFSNGVMFVVKMVYFFALHHHIQKRDVYPMVYSIASGILQHLADLSMDREEEIACTLREDQKNKQQT